MSQIKNGELPQRVNEDEPDFRTPAPQASRYRTIGYMCPRHDEYAMKLDQMVEELNQTNPLITRSFLVRRMVEHGIRKWEEGKK